MTLRINHLFPAVCAIVTIFASHDPSSGAPVASWSLNGIITSSNPIPATSTATDVTAGSLTKSSALLARVFADAFATGGWPLTGAPDPSSYFEFSVSTGSGRAIAFENVLFSLYNNHLGTSNWELRTGVNGFATTLAQGSVTQLVGSGTAISADISALGSRQGQVIFRFYTYANTGALEPDQRGFRGSASGGLDLQVHGIVIGPVGVPDNSGLAFRLDPLRPNPVLRGATIGFSIPASQGVELTIFDVQGRRVRTVLKEPRAAGENSARWDGLTDRGAAAISGLYFAVLRAGTLKATQSVVLLR